MRLIVTMETMPAAGRRNLPPVPRVAFEAMTTTAPASPAPGSQPAPPSEGGQLFVERLRSAAAALAEAAGAVSAVVREVVPPARHRRSRCRVVFRNADGTEADLTFVGAHHRPGAGSEQALDEQIARWLVDGQHRDPAWLVADPDASGGSAIDVTAWLAAG